MSSFERYPTTTHSVVEVVDGATRPDDMTTRQDLGIVSNGTIRSVYGPLPCSNPGVQRFDDLGLCSIVPNDFVPLTAVSTIKRSIVILDETPIDRSSPPDVDRADPQADLLGLDRKTEVTQSPFTLLLLDHGRPHLVPLGRVDQLARLVEEIDMEDDLMCSTVRVETDDQACGEVDLVVARLGGLRGFVED